MKIVIVDDEPLVRIGIKSSYDWEKNGFDIVGEADEGEKALTLIEQLKPDIVILDIKMPKKDGLQVLKEIKERNIKSYVIILSSFDDLDHVKMAMKLGAKDYFHKPTMNGSQIADALNQFKKSMVQDQIENDEHEEKASKPSIQLIKNMLHGEIENVQNIKIKERNMCVIVFAVKKYEEILKRYSNESKDFLNTSLVNIMREIIAKEVEVEFVSVEENQYVLVISNSHFPSIQEAISRINNLVTFIINSFKRLMNIDLVLGISELVHSFQELSKAYTQSKVALGTKFFEPNKHVFYHQQEAKKGNGEQIEKASSYISELKNLLSENRFEPFLELFSNWQHFMIESRCIDENDLKKIYKGFLFIFTDNEEYFQIGNMLDDVETFDELSELFFQIINDRVRDKMNEMGKLSPITKRILTYLESNYKGEISLKQLSETFYTSPNYISKLFNKEMERGILDYVNELRINKAKELLKNEHYKIYEVAQFVGFKSQVHFTIVFNKYEGMSPKDYRKNVTNK